MRHGNLPALALRCTVLSFVLCGCDSTDPYVREGLWRPTGANDTNLRAMIANPGDLRFGKAAATSSGDVAAIAVGRLRADVVKPLPDSSITTVHVNGAGAGQPSAPGAGTAADPVAAANMGNAGGSGS